MKCSKIDTKNDLNWAVTSMTSYVLSLEIPLCHQVYKFSKILSQSLWSFMVCEMTITVQWRQWRHKCRHLKSSLCNEVYKFSKIVSQYLWKIWKSTRNDYSCGQWKKPAESHSEASVFMHISMGLSWLLSVATSITQGHFCKNKSICLLLRLIQICKFSN